MFIDRVNGVVIVRIDLADDGNDGANAESGAMGDHKG